MENNNIMIKITDSDLLNQIISWISTSDLKLQDPLAIKFIASGHGWYEFDLHLWDGKVAYLEAWVDRDDEEITISDRGIGAKSENRNWIGVSTIKIMKED